MYEKILIPVDGSEVSDHAAKEGLKLAERLGSEVVLLYVVDTSLVSIPESESGIPDMEVVRESFRSQGDKVLARLAGPLKDGGVKVDTLISEGHVDDEIVGTADEMGAGVIVLGTHGRRGLRRLLLGSVAESVTRRAHCPVLLVRP